jgi:methylenetetrahydrofolate--tRNA-(uracil-5-)-methyltransferase
MTNLTIIGGGLAGCEAAWQAAERGLTVDLYEMRPTVSTGAHSTEHLAELVCSNSLGSTLPDRASGLLNSELRRLGSMLLECAIAAQVPAGAALAVDRELFASMVTGRIEGHRNIRVIRGEVTSIPDGIAVIATGPLTSPALTTQIIKLTGQDNLYFFDAIAPIVARQSIDTDIVFRASRRGPESESGDYLNCPLNAEEYYAFVDALAGADRIELRGFESPILKGVDAGRFFEGCLPVEVIAERGRDSLAFGPLRPVGLKDPRTGRRPYAVVQLRQDNLAGDLFNLVGFQTNLKYEDQQRVFRLIPGLGHAQFLRFGQMHRNTFIAAPLLLRPTLQFARRPDLFFAGQLTGIEGYLGNIASGLLAGLNAARLHHGEMPLELPNSTMLGALCHYITHADMRNFQPMKANFGILPPLDSSDHKGKQERGQAHADRARSDLESYLTATLSTV